MAREKMNTTEKLRNATDNITPTELSRLKKNIDCLSPEKIDELRAIIEQKAEVTIETKQKLKDLLTECNTLPEIAMKNPQIYEFLNGKINSKDTLATIQTKLGKKIYNIFLSFQDSNDFPYDIDMEIQYRKNTKKPASEVLPRAFNQMQNEHKAIVNLSAEFMKLNTESIEKMNDFIIDYYNTMGGTPWKSKDLEQWKRDLDKERAKTGYTYENFTAWKSKKEQKDSLPKDKTMRM